MCNVIVVYVYMSIVYMHVDCIYVMNNSNGIDSIQKSAKQKTTDDYYSVQITFSQQQQHTCFLGES